MNLLETVFFTFRLLEKEKYKNETFGGKKRDFLCFYSVCMFFFVGLWVCLAVAVLQTSSFNIGE